MSFKIVATDFAIDLGTSNVLVYKKNQGVILNEPSIVVLDENNTNVKKVGLEAKEMLGKTPSNLHVEKPIVNGVVTDFNLTEVLLNYFFKKVNPGFTIIQPKVVMCVPAGITDIATRAVLDAALHAGARDVLLVDQTLASAFGMGLSPDDPKGILLINLGAGTSQACVISLNGVVTSKTINKGGDYLDDKIIDFFRENKKLDIGKNTAEKVKKNLVSLRIKDGDLKMSVSGRDMISASPKTVEVTSKELVNTIIGYADELVSMVYEVLEKTPPELSADIKRDGFGLTGALSGLMGIREYMESKLKLTSYISEDPATDAIIGAGKILEEPDRFLKFSK